MAYTELKLDREKEIIEALRKTNLHAVGQYLKDKVAEDMNINELTKDLRDEVVFLNRKTILHQIEYLALILTKK